MCKKNVIVLTANNIVIREIKVFLHILSKNYPNHPDIILFHKDFTQEEIAFFAKYSKLKLIDSKQLVDIAGPGLLHRENYDLKAFYMRFNLYSDQFDQYDKILYIDIDIVILKPLDELFENEDFFIVRESSAKGFFYDHSDPKLLSILKEDKMEYVAKAPSANSGLFVIPKKRRSKETFNELLKITDRYSDFIRVSDQSVNNIWLAKHNIKPSDDYRYNFQIRLIDQQRSLEFYKSTKTIHFNGMHNSQLVHFMMATAYLCFRIPLLGPFIFFHLHRFCFKKSKIRYPKLRKLLFTIDRFYTKLFNK